ncbi:ankyrin repeat-containing domain protein [Xylogone sp. PMI_703]|nr:ankyrin repeat-containing domain protein [Xylogone sp. PMI_703]
MERLPLESLIGITQYIDLLTLRSWILTSKHYHNALIEILHDKASRLDRERGWPYYLACATLLDRDRVTDAFASLLKRTDVKDINQSNIIPEKIFSERVPKVLRPAWPKPRATSSLLHIACQLCSDDVVKCILAKGVNPNLLDGLNWAPLHLVAYSGRTAIIRILLDASAKVNALVSYGNSNAYADATPFIIAVDQKHIPAMVALIEGGADPKSRLNIRGDALSVAVHGGDIDVIRYVLGLGCYDGEFMMRALGYATRLEDVLPTRILLDAGADPQSALHSAILADRLDHLKLLIDAGADVRAANRLIGCVRSLRMTQFLLNIAPGLSNIARHSQSFQRTPLESVYGNARGSKDLNELEEMILLLIADGCPLQGLTPESEPWAHFRNRNWNILGAAALWGHLRVLKIGLERTDSLLNLRDDRIGHTPLQCAAYSASKNKPACFKLLVEHGADIHATIFGCVYSTSLQDPGTPCPMLENAEITQYLVDMGIDINEAFNGQFPLIHALETGNDPSAVILINAGAEIYIRSGEDLSPLQLAAHHGCVESMERLLQAEHIETLVESADGKTLLHHAVMGALYDHMQVKGYAKMMGYILLGHHNVSVEEIAGDESAELQALAHIGRMEVVRRLCSKGIVDPGARIIGSEMTPFDLLSNPHVLASERRERQIAEVAGLLEEADQKWPCESLTLGRRYII